MKTLSWCIPTRYSKLYTAENGTMTFLQHKENNTRQMKSSKSCEIWGSQKPKVFHELTSYCNQTENFFLWLYWSGHQVYFVNMETLTKQQQKATSSILISLMFLWDHNSAPQTRQNSLIKSEIEFHIQSMYNIHHTMSIWRRNDEDNFEQTPEKMLR